MYAYRGCSNKCVSFHFLFHETRSINIFLPFILYAVKINLKFHFLELHNFKNVREVLKWISIRAAHTHCRGVRNSNVHKYLESRGHRPRKPEIELRSPINENRTKFKETAYN